MHEFALCQGLLSQVETLAREHEAVAVTTIRLHIGPLAGVEPVLLEEAFSVARLGTVAAAAELVFEAAPLRVHCDACGQESEVPVNRLLCPACGDHRTRLVSGDELILASVEMETEAEPAARHA